MTRAGVVQWLTLPVMHMRASGRRHRMPCRRIPDVRRPETGYSCACPSATRQNFSDEPIDVVWCSPSCCRYSSSSLSLCERLITTSGGRASRTGSAYARRTLPSGFTFRRAVHHLHHRGINHAQYRFPFSIRAMLTVNSPLRLINSFVPSSGSTSQ